MRDHRKEGWEDEPESGQKEDAAKGKERAKKGRIPPYIRSAIYNLMIFGPFIGLAMMHRPFDVMTVTGGSMRPLFNPNSDIDEFETRDRMLVWRQSHTKAGDISRGDIVVLRTPHDPNKIAVKRVVALPGDRVLPLKGFEGTDDEMEEGIVVPFNHMWVEGDVDDRTKSVDSNWYGAISQNLVIGRAWILLSPRWKPRSIRVHEHTWPAHEKRRVEYNAVAKAALDPSEHAEDDWFDGEGAQMLLHQLRTDRQLVIDKIIDTDTRERVVKNYQMIRRQYARTDLDEDKKAMVTEILKEIEANFYRAGGGIEHPVFPEIKLEIMEEAQKMRLEVLEKERRRKQERGQEAVEDDESRQAAALAKFEARQERRMREIRKRESMKQSFDASMETRQAQQSSPQT